MSSRDLGAELDMMRLIRQDALTTEPLHPVVWQLARWLVEYSDWRAIESFPDGWQEVLERMQEERSR